MYNNLKTPFKLERVNNSHNETILICNHTLFISIQHREEHNKKFYI